MRKGKGYRYIQPPRMAPDMPGFAGYPYEFSAFISFRYAGVDHGIGTMHGDVEPVVDLKKLSVEYRWEPIPFITRVGVRTNIRADTTRGGVILDLGVVTNAGDTAAVTAHGFLPFITGGDPGFMFWQEPWDFAVYNGRIEEIYLTWIQPWQYKQGP